MIWYMKCGCVSELVNGNKGLVELTEMKQMCPTHARDPMRVSMFVCEIYVEQDKKGRENEWARIDSFKTTDRANV